MNPLFTRSKRSSSAIIAILGFFAFGIISDSYAGPTPTPSPSPTPNSGRGKKAPPAPPNVAPYSG